MSKADRVVRLFPSIYRARERTKLLYAVVQCLASPLEEADTLLFRIQRAHRLKVAEHHEDIMRLAASLNLTPFHFEDILADPDLAYADRLARMRDRVLRAARVHLVGLGTPWAVLEAAAIFLDATIVPERAGDPPIKHLDEEGFSHVAVVEFGHEPAKPRERVYLHENPLRRRKEEPAARRPMSWWTITNDNVQPSPVTVSIRGVAERTVRPHIFCPDTGEGLLFNGIVPEGKTLLLGPETGAQLDGAPVDAWVIYHKGGIYDFATTADATAVVEDGRESPPFDGDVDGSPADYHPNRKVPDARVGPSQWYFTVALGVYDGSQFDYSAYNVPSDPIAAYDGDFEFDRCVFDYPPSAIAGMAWDERLPCAFKLLLPAHLPRSKAEPAAGASGTGPGPSASEAPAVAASAPAGQSVNYVGRVGSILPRFKPAAIRAYVGSARDAWVLGESLLRRGDATDGEGVAFHAPVLRDPRSDMFVDAESAS